MFSFQGRLQPQPGAAVQGARQLVHEEQGRLHCTPSLLSGALLLFCFFAFLLFLLFLLFCFFRLKKKLFTVYSHIDVSFHSPFYPECPVTPTPPLYPSLLTFPLPQYPPCSCLSFFTQCKNKLIFPHPVFWQPSSLKYMKYLKWQD